MNRAIRGPHNGLLPVQHQAIIWTNDDLLSIRLIGINFSEIFIKKQNISFHKKFTWKYRLQNGGHLVEGLIPYCTSVKACIKRGSILLIPIQYWHIILWHIYKLSFNVSLAVLTLIMYQHMSLKHNMCLQLKREKKCWQCWQIQIVFCKIKWELDGIKCLVHVIYLIQVYHFYGHCWGYYLGT